VAWPLLLESVALGAKVVDLSQHSIEQCLGRGGGYASTSKLENLAALSVNLRSISLLRNSMSGISP
jgi:hypothetical protein